MNFAELVGAEAYISGNVGSASPRELAEWVEYVTSPAGSLANERAANGRKDPWKLPYIGLGNELWGCGGNMRPEYAADVTRRYSTFIKVPAGVKIKKSASGPSDEDYNWMEVMMRDAGRHFDAIGLHYYTITENWQHKGSATQFDEAAYARTLQATVAMDRMIARHSAIMDKYTTPPSASGSPSMSGAPGSMSNPAPTPRLPLSAEHPARRHGRRPEHQHLHQTPPTA